jgi:ATP-dependent DNA helicase
MGSIPPSRKRLQKWLLHSVWSENIHVVSSSDDKNKPISDEALDALLDRRPEVFEERGKGWKKDQGQGSEASALRTPTSTRTAFEVFEGVHDDGADGLAMLMGDDED